MTVQPTGPRFGVWALNPGTWAAYKHPGDPFDATWRRVRDHILQAERLGFDSTLIAQHTLHPRGDAFAYLDAWTSAAALAAATNKIEIIAAIKPPLIHPVVLAKQATGIEEISNGRFAINVVNGWFKPELERSGITLLEHDERYVYGREWVTIVRSLLEGARTTFHGKYFHVDDVVLNPLSTARLRPTIYIGGESEPARDLAASLGDVWFINGQPFNEVQSLIASVRSRERRGPPIRFGLSAYIIARPTAAEAQAELERAWVLAEQEKGDLAYLFASVDPKVTMFKTFEKYPHIGTNGGTAAGLVGSYDEVAQRICAFHDAGIELFMLQFQPVEAETERFAAEIIPRVRKATALAGAA
jgi:alkanesulfonate monooxygenase